MRVMVREVASRRKGSLGVREAKKTSVAIWLSRLLVVSSLFPGCAQRRPTVDLYLDAVMLRELGQNELAVRKLNTVVAADPDFALAHLELGKAYQVLGDYEKALGAFRRAATLDPWSFESHMSLGASCGRLGKHADAAGAYARAVELDSASLDAMIGAAESYLQAGQHLRALVYCQLAEQTGQKPQDVLRLLGRVYEGQKDYEQAIKVYRRLTALDANDVDAMLSLARAHMKADQCGRARDILVSVAQVRPDDSIIFRYLGYCFAKLSDADRAIQMYERSIELDANDWEAHRGLGVAYMLKARQTADARPQAKAIWHWRRSLAIAPDQPKHEVLKRLIREHSNLENPLQGLNY